MMHVLYAQVFLSILIGAFALGNAGSSLENLGTATGAAYFIFHLIDRVTPLCVDYSNCYSTIKKVLL